MKNNKILFLINIKTILFSVLIITFLLSCNKKKDTIVPDITLANLEGKWTFKTIKNLQAKNSINAKTGATITFSATKYTTSIEQPFAATVAGDTYTFEAKGGNASTVSIKSIKTIMASQTGNEEDKKKIDGYLAKYEAEGIKNIAMITGMSLIVKSKDGSFTVPWQLYSIREITANKMTLELFYGELLNGTSTPQAERLTITFEK